MGLMPRRADKRGLFPAWIKPAVSTILPFINSLFSRKTKDTEPPPLLVYKVRLFITPHGLTLTVC